MARDLGISEGTAGQVVTATALVGAIAALLSNVLIGRLDRKNVLVWLSILAIASNLLSTFATDFWLLLVGRADLGIALSAFWALSVAVVARLVLRPLVEGWPWLVSAFRWRALPRHRWAL